MNAFFSKQEFAAMIFCAPQNNNSPGPLARAEKSIFLNLNTLEIPPNPPQTLLFLSPSRGEYPQEWTRNQILAFLGYRDPIG
jgi:hypothetical protein